MEDLFLYILLLFITLAVVAKHFHGKIRNLPPSPFPCFPVVGHLHLLRDPLHRSLFEISRRHGSILFLRFGCRQALLVSSPAAAEECLHKNDTVFANRPDFVAGEIFGYNFTAITWAPYGDLWRNLRRISNTEVLSPHRLELLAGIRADEVKSLLRRIYHHENQEDGSGYRTVDLNSAFLETTMNVMTRILAGRRYYGEGEESEEGRRFKDLMRDISNAGGFITIGDFFPVLRKIGIKGAEKRYKSLFNRTDAFLQDLVDDYRRRSVKGDSDLRSEDEISNKSRTMIEVLLSLQNSDPEFYTEEIIKGHVLIMLLGGTDTSAGTMEWALSLLLNHPEAIKKARAEIDEHVGRKRLIEESDLNNLPYLHSLILETLRIRPVGPLLVRHSSEECSVGGYKVPRGTMLMVNVWALHHDPEVWEEPDEFKPERFDGVQGNRVGFRSMPFGVGRRACPGEGLAMRMVGLVLGALIQCFEWERAGEELVDLQENVGITAPKAKPLVAKCRPCMETMNLIS